MNKKKIVNLVLLLATVIVLTICAFSVRIEAAADAVAVMKTSGMTCGSCAGRIERVLKEKGGVSFVEVDLEGGRVVVAYDSKVARAEALAESVTGIGYGSSILQTMSAEEYRRITGGKLPSGGCACCNKMN